MEDKKEKIITKSDSKLIKEFGIMLRSKERKELRELLIAMARWEGCK